MSASAEPPAKRAKIACTGLQLHLQRTFPLSRLPTDIGATIFEFLRVAEMCMFARACATLRAFAKNALRRPRASLICAREVKFKPQMVPLGLERAAAACPRAARIRSPGPEWAPLKYEDTTFGYHRLSLIARLACAPHLRELSLFYFSGAGMSALALSQAFPRLEVVRIEIEVAASIFKLAQAWEHVERIEVHGVGEYPNWARCPEPTAREARALNKVTRFDVQVYLSTDDTATCEATLFALVRQLPPHCAVRLRVIQPLSSDVLPQDVDAWHRFERRVIDTLSDRLRGTQWATRVNCPSSGSYEEELLVLRSENYGGAGYSDVEAVRNDLRASLGSRDIHITVRSRS